MGINADKFIKWAISRFGEENVEVKGKEVKLNSIFPPYTDDTGHHLWCSPSGGKKKHKYGVYHCLKSEKSGNLVKLVQLVDSCDREDALATLDGRTSIRELEKQLEEMFKEEDEVVIVPVPDLPLPAGSVLISELGTNNWWRKKAEEYLNKRKIPIDGLYVCTEGNYKTRIIIPYYDRQHKLIYWNARTIGTSKCKYLGPPKEVGVGKEDVIFMAGNWPALGSTIYLCEGEFNAISLKLCELNAAACGGKNMSEKQALMLSEYKVVLCLDRDKAGKAGTSKMIERMVAVETVKGSNEKLMVIAPPTGFNDWNEMLIKFGPTILFHYLMKNQKPLDYSNPFGMHSEYVNSNLWN